MAFNGAGVFNRLYNWVQDKANSEKIQAARMDAEFDGIATGLSNCVTRDGQSTVTADISVNNFKLTNVANATSSGDAVSRSYGDTRYVQYASANADILPDANVQRNLGSNALKWLTLHAKIWQGDLTDTITYDSTNDVWRVAIGASDRFNVEGLSVYPGASDGAISLGLSFRRWGNIYGVTGVVNTSDAREKTAVRALSANEIAAAQALADEIGAFQWLDQIAEKGADAARLHVGMTVQRAIEIMDAHGLQVSPFDSRYAFICFDQWETDEAMGVVAGDRYGFRYDQLAMFILAGLNARLKAVESAIAGA